MNDSSTASRQIQIEAIRQFISNGDLTAQQIHDVMLAEITTELSKPQEEVDIDYVNACQALLMELNSPRAAVTPSHYEQNLTAVRKKFQPRFSFAPHTLWGRFATVLCLIVLITTAGLLMPEGWIITRQSEDEGQYIMQGIETPDGFRSVAEAGPALDHIGVYKTNDWQEAVHLLGGKPYVPQWLPTGWSILSYTVSLTDVSSGLTIVYYNETSDARIVFQSTTFFELSSLHRYVEQDEEGITIELSNGTQVYFTDNLGKSTATWYSTNCSYLLSGAISRTELIRIAESID